MKSSIKKILLVVILLGIFIYNYIQSDGMRLLPFEFHASKKINQILGIIFLLLILWQYIRGIIKVKQMKRFNTPTLVVISIIFIVLHIYGIVYLTHYF